jgi:hypothetical protein
MNNKRKMKKKKRIGKSFIVMRIVLGGKEFRN